MGRMENIRHISGSLRLRKLGSVYHWWCNRKHWVLVCSLKALLRMPVVTGFSFCIYKIVKCECKWEFKSTSTSTKPGKECKLKIRIKLELCTMHFTVKFRQWLDTFTSKMQICSYFWNTVNAFNEFMRVLFFLLSSPTQESGMRQCGDGAIFFSLRRCCMWCCRVVTSQRKMHWCKSVPPSLRIGKLTSLGDGHCWLHFLDRTSGFALGKKKVLNCPSVN